MTVEVALSVVKRFSANGRLHPAFAVLLDAPVTRQVTPFDPESAMDSAAEVHRSCVKTPEKTRVEGALRSVRDLRGGLS